MASAVWTCSHVVLRPLSTFSPPPPPPYSPSLYRHRKVDLSKPIPALRHRPFWSSTRTIGIASLRVSSQPSQGGGRDDEEEGEEGSTSSIDASLIISDDLGYIWKLAAGSIGGASAIKYGSVLFPGITRPNIVEALLMITLPVVVAILILAKESSKESQDDLL